MGQMRRCGNNNRRGSLANYIRLMCRNFTQSAISIAAVKVGNLADAMASTQAFLKVDFFTFKNFSLKVGNFQAYSA